MPKQMMMLVGFVLLVFTGFSGCVFQPPPPPPVGDFGDAPDGEPTGYQVGPGAGADGNFPSLYNSPNVRLAGNRGIVHLNADPNLRFGLTINQEPDAQITDQDGSDDGNPTLVISNAGQNGTFSLDIMARDGNRTEQVSGFVNILMDLNQDGVWQAHDDQGITVPEWVVQNFPVSLQRGGYERITTPSFRYGPNSVRTEAWARLALTPTPIDATAFNNLGGWDGSGPVTGHADGETEDWLFACEGSLRITYPLTQDSFPNRIIFPPAAAPTITVVNTAAQRVVYVFIARAQVAVPVGASYVYVDVNRNNPEWRLTVNTAVPAGSNVNPAVANPLPDQLITLNLDAGATATLTLTGVNVDIPVVLDPTQPPPPGNDARLTRVLLHPLGPCLRRLQKINDEPVFMRWP